MVRFVHMFHASGILDFDNTYGGFGLGSFRSNIPPVIMNLIPYTARKIFG